MNTELQTIIEHMAKERGIDRVTLIEAVEFALQSGVKKSEKSLQNIRVEVDRENCEIRAYAPVQVVERAKLGQSTEISLENARKTKPDAQIGDTVEIQVRPRNLGRIAAQTAKQAILQKIRSAEREIVYEEYKDRVGEIVSGSVRQFDRGDIMVDLGRTEAILPSSERVPTEEYQIGDRIRGYILKVEKGTGGATVLLSRSHPDFVKALFRLEVSEIADGVVEMKGIAREPGYRTKIAVLSHDERVDPVGACVGMRGIRVKNIVRELGGEKIDIVRWSDDIKTYVGNALSPARLLEVTMDPEIPNLIHVVTEADQLSLAIGKKGQNVRLTAKLVGWKIDIRKEEGQVSFEEKVVQAVEALAAVPGITREDAVALVKAGFLTVEGILAAERSELAETAGFDEQTANRIREAAESVQKQDVEISDVVESAESEET